METSVMPCVFYPFPSRGVLRTALQDVCSNGRAVKKSRDQRAGRERPDKTFLGGESRKSRVAPARF